MFGMNMTYEELCEFIQITRKSSSPTTVTELNPVIKQLLADCPGSSVYSIGGRSVVISISGDIVAKVSLKPGDRHMSHEQTIFELLDRTPCPHIVQTFLRRPDITFMQCLNNGTLYERMSIVDKPQPVLQWAQQLSIATAWLESQGYAHGDMCPRNILFDGKDQLKLVDFDHALKIGENLDIGYEPYVRCRRGGQIGGGQYGTAGATTEQFALGSIFWYMSRGTELYHELEGSERVNHLIDGRFPATDHTDPIERMIGDCWHGRFQSIADLSKRVQEIATLDERYRKVKKRVSYNASR